MGYEVKNVKSFQGREGYGYECSLYCDGKRVAKAVNVANGGEVRFYWADKNAPKVEVTYEFYGREVTSKVSPAEKAILESIKGKTYEFYGETYNHSIDTFVGGLVDEYEANKQFRRWCKAKTVFRLKGDKEDSWRTLSAPYAPGVKDLLVKKYGEKVEEILNERFVA